MYKKYFIDNFFHTMFNPASIGHHLDERSVVLLEYPAETLGPQYNPVAICCYALEEYNLLLESSGDHTPQGEDEHLLRFISQADWLVENALDRGDFTVWPYRFPWVAPGYICKSPWTSAMAQGLGLSVLIRAAEITGEKRYLNTAERAFRSFLYDVKEGGVVERDGKGDLWFEEYVCPRSARVLNGIMFALVGIHEFAEYTGNRDAWDLFWQGVKTLEKHLKRFNLNTLFFRYSRYDDKLLIFSGEKYHRFHIQELEYLHNAAKSAGKECRVLREYAELWEKYDRVKERGLGHGGYLLFLKFYSYYMLMVRRLFNTMNRREIEAVSPSSKGISKGR
ncbi:MAG: hypothetical protein J7L61_00860 [Thermoplasmata archaeon]|nr:hypothetical protein [Thermoplasmata archaeon]